MKPELSILIINWNTRESTLAALRSISEEIDWTNVEIVLVDNASSDGSAEAIAAEFPEVVLLRETVNHGFAKANNIAAKTAQGRMLLLLNPDILVQNNAIGRLMEHAMADDVQLCGGRANYPDGRLNPTCWKQMTLWSCFCHAVGFTAIFPNSALLNPENYGGWQGDVARTVDIVSGCFLLIDINLWTEIGGFDEAFFMYGEEADLCARARARGIVPHFFPDACIVHFGEGSAVGSSDRLIYVYGSRLGLIDRHMNPSFRMYARWLTLVAVAIRALGAKILHGFVRSDASRAAADKWGKVWGKRWLWRHGPLPGPINVLENEERQGE